MRKRVVILSALGVAALLFLVALFWASRANAPEAQVSQEEQAVAMAQSIYAAQKSQETDFSSGPCLTNNLMAGWVADIAHNPRQSVDDLPQNQCSAYKEGKAKHFVELDPEGNFIRAM